MRKKGHYAYSDVGGRENNEDSYIIMGGSTRQLYVLADGLGGHSSGEIASQIAVSVIGSYFTGKDSDLDVKTSAELANSEIIKEQESSSCKMKTTITGVYIANNEAQVLNVGDSRTYLFKDGKIVFQTTDHSVSQMSVAMGDITSDQIRNDIDRNRLTRVLGEKETIKVDVRKFAIDSFDAILLASDGFWEYVYENEMEETLQTAESAEQWIESMKKIMAERIPDNNDNNTAVAVFI